MGVLEFFSLSQALDFSDKLIHKHYNEEKSGGLLLGNVHAF